MKQLQLWIVIAITAGALLYFSLWQQTNKQEKPRTGQQLPSGYVNQASVKQYGDDGQLSSHILSPRLTLYKKTAELEQPVMYNFHENCRKGWKTTAKKGELSNFEQKKDSNILLTGNVLMQRADGRTTLETPSMEFYPKRSYVLGNEAVIIKQPNGRTTANGFTIDLKNQYYRLLQDVKNYYEPGKTSADIAAEQRECLFKRAGQ